MMILKGTLFLEQRIWFNICLNVALSHVFWAGISIGETAAKTWNCHVLEVNTLLQDVKMSRRFIYLSDLLSALSSKTCMSDSVEVHSCHRNWKLTHAERYTEVLEQHILPCRQCLYYLKSILMCTLMSIYISTIFQEDKSWNIKIKP